MGPLQAQCQPDVDDVGDGDNNEYREDNDDDGDDIVDDGENYKCDSNDDSNERDAQGKTYSRSVVRAHRC